MAIKKFLTSRTWYELTWTLGIYTSLKSNRVRGWYGEWLACCYLRKKNFSILRKNWQSSFDARREIDLIAMDNECLVFVEVRARSKNALNSGYRSINHRKRKSILVACRDFLRIDYEKFPFYRFDVIEVDLEQKNGSVLHHQNVSLFT